MLNYSRGGMAMKNKALTSESLGKVRLPDGHEIRIPGFGPSLPPNRKEIKSGCTL